jgi:hypothetical protein
MRMIWMAALLAALAATGAILAPQSATAREAPWCAVVTTGKDNVVYDCRFWSFEACVPWVIAGNRGFCDQNPRFAGAPPRKSRSRRR